MHDRRKVTVSIRMPSADIRRVKQLAERLAVRESDVIRFAVRMMLERLGPLCDREVTGANLVPVFVEYGAELLRFFDLDSARLDAIINGNTEPERQISREDVALLALTQTQQPYAALRLRELQKDDGETTGERKAELAGLLRQYLYEKYLYRQSDARAKDVPKDALKDTKVLKMLGVTK